MKENMVKAEQRRKIASLKLDIKTLAKNAIENAKT